jgi:hypothetical protein
MSSLEMSEEYAADLRRQLHELAAPEVGGEEVVCAGAFRRGGAGTTYAASKLQLGGAVYAGVNMLRKKKAGGLPEKVALVLTPGKLYAFEIGIKSGGQIKFKGEAASWDRTGLHTSTERGSMTALTIEPAEGGGATLVAIGVKDDPVSQELIAALDGSPA